MATSNTTTDKTAKTRVHNVILLDESGSMWSIYEAAFRGVNSTLAGIRTAQADHEGLEQLVTLASFDSREALRYNSIYNSKPIAQVEDIVRNQYKPSGSTPLYDAMGRAISDVRAQVKPGDEVLITVITDGYENASQEFDQKSIRTLVDILTQKGWVFTYIGANQDADKVGAAMGIENCLNFDATPEGTAEMFDTLNECRADYMCCMAAPISAKGSKEAMEKRVEAKRNFFGRRRK
jgi:hypothetical protein